VTHPAFISRVGIVLAGGISRRMGVDKALLSINGITLLDRTVSVLKTAGCTNIVLSGYPRKGFSGTVVPDEVAEAGPVAGIVSCLKHIAKQYPADTECLFIAVDMPRAGNNLFNTLRANSQFSDGAYFEDHPLPFCLRLTDATQALAKSSNGIELGTKTPSIRGFLAPLNISIVRPNAEQLNELININTPDAWEKIVSAM